MSWPVYLLGCLLVSAVAVAVAVIAWRALARPLLDLDRYPRSAARLDQPEHRAGQLWAHLDGAPLHVHGGGRRDAGPRHVVISLLGEGAQFSATASLHKRWRDRLARCTEAELDPRFDAAFDHEAGLDWPSAAAKRALLELAEDPRVRTTGAMAEPGAVRLRLAAVEEISDELLDACFDALQLLAELPEPMRAHDSPPPGSGPGLMLGISLAWALLISTVSTYQAAFAEHSEGTVVARDTSPAANEARLIVALDEGRERALWVPSDMYERCASGQRLVREAYSVTPSCDGERSWHLAFLAQLPFLLLMWMGSAIAVLAWLGRRDEAAHRRELSTKD